MEADQDPLLLITLIAIRRLGGENVSAKQDLFTKGLKNAVADCTARGLVKKEAGTVTVMGKNGKPKTSKVDVLALTQAGLDYLKNSADPETLRITEAADRQAQASRLQERLEAERQEVRAEVMQAIKGQGKVKLDAVLKTMEGLAKSARDLNAKIEKMESQLKASDPDAILRQIDAGFARLQHGGQAIDPVPQAPVTTAPEDLARILSVVYQDLRRYREYEDGLVPLPRMFHKASAQYPGLTVPMFHAEIAKLRDARAIDLMMLNNTQNATELDKAIRKGDDVYYYVFWRTT